MTASAPPDATRAAAPSDRWALRGPVFAAALAVCLAATLAFPAYQWLKGRGYLYYENHLDESSYLQYDFAQLTRAFNRVGEYLVVWLHDRGWAGGYINAAFDAFTFLAFPLVCRAVFRQAGWTPHQANAGALGLVLLPQLVLTSNPVIQWLSDWNTHSGLIQWITMPFLSHSPLNRTPEPQVSLLLLGLAVWAALRWRRRWCVYAVLPCLYPFVSIPAAFVLLADHLRARWPAAARFATAGPLLLAFLAVAGACAAYYALLVGEGVKLILVASHWPLVSFTSVVAIAVYAAMRHWIAPEHRFFALAVALAPSVSANQQLLSGQIPQPSSFELYTGCLTVALVLALALRDRGRWRTVFLLAGGLLFITGTYHTYRVNQSYMIRLPLTDDLVSALATDPRHVVVNDSTLVSTLNMVHPRQAPTALAFETTFMGVADRHVGAYRCVKRQIEADYPGHFDSLLALVDNAYVYSSQNYRMSTIGRKTTFRPLRDVSPEACDDPGALPLRYFFINWAPPPIKASRPLPR